MSSTEVRSIAVSSKSVNQNDANIVILAAAIVQQTGKCRHFAGPAEQALRDAIGLPKESFDTALGYLLENNCVEHKFVQEGTAGPFAHRYKASAGLKVEVTW